MTNISIIIPNLNGAKYLSECLPHLITACNQCPDHNFEIIIVDNDSTDTSLTVAKEILDNNPQIKRQFIVLDKNYGFATAVNAGIQNSKYPYVFLLNNDLNLSKNWLKLVITQIQKNQDKMITTFCGTILDKSGKFYESQGLKFETQGKCLNINNRQKYSSTSTPNQLIWGASAAAVVYHKKTIVNIGLFDPLFFAYEEDVDLAFRLQALGYKTLLIPEAVSYHLGGGTSSKMGNFRHIHDAKNWIILILKNYSTSQIKKYFWPIITERLRNLSGLIKNTIKIYRFKSIYVLPISLAKAYFPIVININSILKNRQKFQSLLKSVNDNRY